MISTDNYVKLITYYLLKNGRTSIREISRRIGISHTTVLYYFKKLSDEGVIGPFYLYVNPNLLGFYHSFVVFKGDVNYVSEVVASKFSCIEGYTIYELLGKSIDEIDELIEKIGEPQMIMKINDDMPRRVNPIVLKMINLLLENPRIDFSELGKQIDLSTTSVKKKYLALEKRGMIKVIPKVDFSRAGITMFSVFSNHEKSEIEQALKDYSILTVKDGERSLYLGVTLDINVAAKLASFLRTIDRDVVFSLKHDFMIFNWMKKYMMN